MITKEELLEKIEKSTCIYNRCYTVRNIIKFYDNVVINDDIIQACNEYMTGAYGGYVELRPNNSLLVCEYND